MSSPKRPVADLLPIRTLIGEGWEDYGLVDSGGGRKLERYGRYRFIRPEPQAMWAPALPASAWEEADGEFIPASDADGGGRWYFQKAVPEIGRASGRESVCTYVWISVGAESLQNKKNN